MKLLLLVTLLFSFNVYSKSTGLKMTSVEPGSMYSQWNLQSGDVVQKINNKEINSLNDLMAYMGNPSSVKNIKVLRNNEEVDLNITK